MNEWDETQGVWRDPATGNTYDPHVGVWQSPEGNTYNETTGVWTSPERNSYSESQGVWVSPEQNVYNEAHNIWVSPEQNTFDPQAGFWRSQDQSQVYVDDTWHAVEGAESTLSPEERNVWNAETQQWIDTQTLNTYDPNQGFWRNQQQTMLLANEVWQPFEGAGSLLAPEERNIWNSHTGQWVDTQALNTFNPDESFWRSPGNAMALADDTWQQTGPAGRTYGQITGTDYFSAEEREWYLNQQGMTVDSRGRAVALGPDGRSFEQIAGTEYMSEAERLWYLNQLGMGLTAFGEVISLRPTLIASPANGNAVPAADFIHNELLAQGYTFTPNGYLPPPGSGLTEADFRAGVNRIIEWQYAYDQDRWAYAAAMEADYVQNSPPLYPGSLAEVRARQDALAYAASMEADYVQNLPVTFSTTPDINRQAGLGTVRAIGLEKGKISPDYFGAVSRGFIGTYAILQAPAQAAGDFARENVPGVTGEIIGGAAEIVLDPFTIATLPLGGAGVFANLFGRGSMSVGRYAVATGVGAVGASAGGEIAEEAGAPVWLGQVFGGATGFGSVLVGPRIARGAQQAVAAYPSKLVSSSFLVPLQPAILHSTVPGGELVTFLPIPQTFIEVSPNELFFSQRTVGGSNLAKVRESMRVYGFHHLGFENPPEPVGVVLTPHGLVTIDNRRPTLALELGIDPIGVEFHLPNELLPPSMLGEVEAPRFGEDAMTWGQAAEYRGARQHPPLPWTGQPDPPVFR